MLINSFGNVLIINLNPYACAKICCKKSESHFIQNLSSNNITPHLYHILLLASCALIRYALFEGRSSIKQNLISLLADSFIAVNLLLFIQVHKKMESLQRQVFLRSTFTLQINIWKKGTNFPPKQMRVLVSEIYCESKQ